ncbi:ABC transporter ATP-binding protein [Pseudonocardia hydrocarbonoxydans]|uniref:ABC transporter ATP-binding protein n=1 Tax=Pseudonocardia abyssalis TaxID=2792008 RepID=A0ABS6V1J6_9PSEU|nr:ABC transporter ATP-binding protein [Pseudonocardia abyssalis]MBW0138385.1 ABC transporter ATP-binding protein [Pseudonocardia abyssalis]
MSGGTVTATRAELVGLDGVSVRFGDTEVLAPTSIQVREREFVTLFGPSGCGKSTLLNIVAGLLVPSSGQVRFDGKAISGINTRIGYMTQDDTLLPWRTVRANVAMPLRMRGVPRPEIADRVQTYLRLLDLEHAADRYPAQLSGGMKRRALLARSMIYEPRMLLMDEPFAAVDARLREGLHDEVRRAVEQADQTVLFVTHDVAEAALLSDRVLVLGHRPGRVVAELTMPFGANRDLRRLRLSEEYLAAQLAVRRALDTAEEDDD